jgi:hypothetical protein
VFDISEFVGVDTNYQVFGGPVFTFNDHLGRFGKRPIEDCCGLAVIFFFCSKRSTETHSSTTEWGTEIRVKLLAGESIEPSRRVPKSRFDPRQDAKPDRDAPRSLKVPQPAQLSQALYTSFLAR